MAHLPTIMHKNDHKTKTFNTYNLSEVKTNGATELSNAVNAFFAAQNDPNPVPADVVFNLTSWERTNVVIDPSAHSSKALYQIDKDGNRLGMIVVA